MKYKFFLMAIAATTAITMSSSAAPADDKEVRQVRLYGQVFDSFTRTYLDSAYIEVLTTDSNVIARDTARTYRSGTELQPQSPCSPSSLYRPCCGSGLCHLLHRL